MFLNNSPEQRRQYEAILKSRDVVDYVNNTKSSPVAAITKLRVVCWHPALSRDDKGESVAVKDLLKQSPKMSFTIDLIGKLKKSGDRALIFSQSTM